MTEQQRPDEEVEGHARLFAQEEGSADEVEGHVAKVKLDDDDGGDDVEGHGRAWL